MKKKKKRVVRRTFCGIQFTKVQTEFGGSVWKAADGTVLMENHIGVKFEKWSVEEGPKRGGTGYCIREALINSEIIPR